MATPRVDDAGRTTRSRASSFANATSEQSALSEDEDEQLQKRAKGALQKAQALEAETTL